MRKGVVLLVAVMLISALSAVADQSKELISALRKELSESKSPQDSIRILYDIFDLTERKNSPAVLAELDKVATRAGDNYSQLYAARHLANVYNSDSMLTVLEKRVEALPSAEDQKETLLFIRMRKVALKELYGNSKERHDNITRIMAMNDTTGKDKYENLLNTFNICEYLSVNAPGPLLLEYMDELEEQVKDAQLKNPYLKNLFLAEAANIYTGVNASERAVKTDRELLKVIDELDKTNKAQGRKYHTSQLSRFIIYRRMLSNYNVLSVEEVNDLYEKIQNLASENEEVRKSLAIAKRAPIYHAMKNGHYAEALKYLKETVPIEQSKVRKRHLLEMMITAADSTGDVQTAQNARRDLDVLNHEISTQESKQKYNELKIRYDISSLKAENAELELQNKNEQIANSKRSIMLVAVLWVVFFLILAVSLYYWSRYSKVLAGLNSFIKTVEDERDMLKARRYYDYNVNELPDKPDVPQVYNKIGGNKHDSRKVIEDAINDILFISSISMEDSRKYRQTVSVGKLMENCVSTLSATLTRNININVSYPEPDFDIRVDKDCLEQLINQILNKAMLLAPEGGSIGFGCELDKSSNMARFVFKHSGQGLPHGQEERIFEGFFNYEDSSEDGESTMRLCRMINFLSNCSLKSSSGRSNVSGGRLVLMVPVG